MPSPTLFRKLREAGRLVTAAAVTFSNGFVTYVSAEAMGATAGAITIRADALSAAEADVQPKLRDA